jgi:hypothetical protein
MATSTIPGAPPGVIPNQAVYAQAQAAAEAAYARAVTLANQQKNQLYQEYGLLQNGQVDPKSRYGGYQNLLGNDALALQSAENAGFDRGLGGKGLGAQGVSAQRQINAVGDLSFQRGVSKVGSDYANAITSAESEKKNAMIQALIDAIQTGYSNQDFPTAPTAPTTGDSPLFGTPPSPFNLDLGRVAALGANLPPGWIQNNFVNNPKLNNSRVASAGKRALANILKNLGG